MLDPGRGMRCGRTLSEMGIRLRVLSCVVTGIFLTGCMTPPPGGPHAVPPAPAGEVNLVFCPIQGTGQLCAEGSIALLNLKGEEKQNWVAAMQRYNEKVTEAQESLIQNSGKFLTPVQIDHLRAWFAAQKYSEGEAVRAGRAGRRRSSGPEEGQKRADIPQSRTHSNFSSQEGRPQP